jgi:hypothetical protein
MAPLQNKPWSSYNALFVFYDFETTQGTRYTQSTTRNVTNLVCLQQFCAMCENQPDANLDCQRCGVRQHSFWEDPLGDMSYVCEPRPWADRVVAIAHNALFYTHYFNTSENLNYVGAMPDVSYYAVDPMSHSERQEFLEWYEGQKGTTFDNKHVLESCCQDDVSVMSQACQIFRHSFLEIGNI